MLFRSLGFGDISEFLDLGEEICAFEHGEKGWQSTDSILRLRWGSLSMRVENPCRFARLRSGKQPRSLLRIGSRFFRLSATAPVKFLAFTALWRRRCRASAVMAEGECGLKAAGCRPLD